jgi:hypothetical protein
MLSDAVSRMEPSLTLHLMHNGFAFGDEITTVFPYDSRTADVGGGD